MKMKLKILELIEYFHADQTQNNNTPFSSEDYEEAIAELEKVILDCYLAKGYKVGIGEWGFKVDITSLYKQKAIHIYFYDNNDNESVIIFFSKTTKEMFDKAIEHFSVRQNEVNKCQ